MDLPLTFHNCNNVQTKVLGYRQTTPGSLQLSSNLKKMPQKEAVQVMSAQHSTSHPAAPGKVVRAQSSKCSPGMAAPSTLHPTCFSLTAASAS